MEYEDQLKCLLKERQRTTKRLKTSKISHKQYKVIQIPQFTEEEKVNQQNKSDIKVEAKAEFFTISPESLATSSLKSKEEKRKAKKNHSRSTIVVTTGALTFILLAATMVTTSFLMSPIIEKMFGKIEHSLYC